MTTTAVYQVRAKTKSRQGRLRVRVAANGLLEVVSYPASLFNSPERGLRARVGWFVAYAVAVVRVP